jgi:hypothetical protein
MNNRLSDLRTNAADDAVGAHQAGGRHGLEEMLRHQRIDSGYARNIDDGNFGAGFHNPLQQILHHHLCARAVERANQRQREDGIVQLHYRGGQFQHLFLLARDEIFAAFLETFQCESQASSTLLASRRPEKAPALSAPFSCCIRSSSGPGKRI